MATQGPQFDGFLGGWLGAEDRRQQMMERERANAAYNALFETYGPVAGDPVAYGQLAGIKRAEDRAPLELDALRLGNEGAQQGIDQSNALFPVTLEQAKLGNDQLAQTIDQNGAKFPLEQAQRRANIEGTQLSNKGQALGNEAAEGGIKDADTIRRRQALTTGVRLLMGVRDSGGDMGMAFDRLVPTLEAIGMDPGGIAEARSQIINDPTTLDAMAASLTGFPAPGKAATAKVGTTNPDGSPMTEEQKYRARERGKAAAKAEAAVYDRENTNEGIVTNAVDAANDITTAAQALLDPDVLENAFGWSALGRNINATDYADAAAALDTLKSKIRVNIIKMLKDSSKTGATGFGALSDTEGKVLESMLGALTPEQSAESAEKTLRRVIERMNELTDKARKIADDDNANARKKAAALYRESPLVDGEGGSEDESGGVPLPPELQGAAEGEEIEADDGTVYVVRGGQLVPK